jgi:aspartyl protease family protein
MDEFETMNLVYLVVLLVMVAGWFFFQNRDGLNKTMQQAAIWGVIFVGAAAGVALWQDIGRDGGTRSIAMTESGQIVVPRERDGHYYLTLDINDSPVRFVVDTGATDMVLTREDAARAGIDPEDLNFLGRALTANGEVRTAFVRLDEVRLGDHVDTDVAAVVNDGAMPQSLLGMGYLQRWGKIEIGGGELILTR